MIPQLDMKSHDGRGLLITFCGLDGCGKSTMIRMLRADLEETGAEVLVTKQPTDGMRHSPIFRNYMDADDHSGYEYRALSLMAAADRVQHANQVILPALRRGARIYSDSNMIKSGLSVPKLKRFFPGYERESILCPVADTETGTYARERGITRALAAVELHASELDGAVFLCGNAPLALAGVVRLAVERGIAPALIIGMPVGFVNVVESKKLLDSVRIPYVRISGRRGGSPLAVAALHGMMECGLE